LPFCRAGHETVCDTLRKTNFDPGGFAEFVRVPRINVEKGTFAVPDNVSFEEVLHAISQPPTALTLGVEDHENRLGTEFVCGA
jgi:threonine dehydrogenase-like Zn-dependent dehydrogenase